MKNYDHLVCFNEETRQLAIYRVDAEGRKTLFTSIALPQSKGWVSPLEGFARQLGENLIMDSPVARKLFDL